MDKVVVYMEITGSDVMTVLEVLHAGFKKFSKRKVIIGTPKETGAIMKDTIVIAPFSVETKHED